MPLARKLVPLLREGMLLLADRAYDAAELLKESPRPGRTSWSAAAPAASPRSWRSCPTGPTCPGSTVSGCGSSRPDLDVHGADGTRIGDGYRLITTLLDWRRYPAGELVRLYHERWVRHEVAWSEWNSQKEDRFMSVT